MGKSTKNTQVAVSDMPAPPAPQYDNPNAPGYVEQKEGTVRYPMLEGIPFDFLPNEGTITEGTVTMAGCLPVKQGTYLTNEGLEIVVQHDGKANIIEPTNEVQENSPVTSAVENEIPQRDLNDSLKAVIEALAGLSDEAKANNEAIEVVKPEPDEVAKAVELARPFFAKNKAYSVLFVSGGYVFSSKSDAGINARKSDPPAAIITVTRNDLKE